MFNIFVLVDVNGTKSQAVYDITRQLEEFLALKYCWNSQ